MLIKLVKHLIFLAPGVVAGLGLSWLIIGILAGSQSIFLHMIISSIIAASLTYIILHRLTKSHIPPLVKIIDTVAIGSAEISHEIDSFQKSASHQGLLANDLTTSTQQLANESENFSEASNETVNAATQARDATEKGQKGIENILKETYSASDEAMSTSEAFSRLLKSTNKIHSIIEIINEITMQTHLLSLNATIEAAQAGKHGRGFSVVANEIRNLSGKTKDSTKDIDEVLNEIKMDSKNAETTMQSLAQKVTGVVSSTEVVRDTLSEIKETAIVFEQLAQRMAVSLKDHVDPIKNISSSIDSINKELETTARESGFSSQHALNITKQTELALEELFKFGTINNNHYRIFMIATDVAKNIEKLFEQAVSGNILSEANLFDTDYQPTPGTNPQKFTTKFDAYTDQYLPDIQESVLKENTELAFVIATNVDGYVPTHNACFAHSPTGNYDVDLVKSRSKRIFSDRVGQRCGSHTKEFLLQTYKRDTGEVMHDLSVPVYVNGKHWGGVRIGYAAVEAI